MQVREGWFETRRLSVLLGLYSLRMLVLLRAQIFCRCLCWRRFLCITHCQIFFKLLVLPLGDITLSESSRSPKPPKIAEIPGSMSALASADVETVEIGCIFLMLFCETTFAGFLTPRSETLRLAAVLAILSVQDIFASSLGEF